MINITNENNSVVFYIDDEQVLAFPLNELSVLTEEVSDIVMFKTAKNFKTVVQERWEEITINGEPITKENVVDKFNEIANTNEGGAKINAGTNITLQPEADGSITISATGELGGTVAWQDVTDKPSTFTPSAHNHVVADITDLQGKLDAKQDTLVSGTNIKTINGQDILGSGDIVIEGGTGDVTKQYVDEQLALKVDKTAYEADKATFALKTEIPSIEGLASKEELQNGLDGKQDKGDYALKSELPDISGLATKAEVDETYAKKTDIPDTSDFATKEELASKADASALSTKQDTLISGTNIKTINGQTLLGEGNIEIQGGGGGIADAPSDGKKYVRQNANWVEETTVDTSNFATKAELDGKVDDAEIADMLTKTEAASTYQPKGEYLTSIPDEYVTETELSGKGYATTSQLDSKLDTETYNSDKSTFATKEELADKANTSDLSNYLQTSVAESTYAKKSEIPEEYTLPIATAEALGGIKVGAGLSINPETGVLNATGGGTADSVDWANITSKPETFTPSAHNHSISEVTDLQTTLDGKVDYSEIADMATKTWVGEQGFLTEHQDISQLATKQEVTEGLATKQDKGDYATKAELGNKVDVSAYTEDKATFALKSELTNLATKDELNLKANSSDLSNYLTTTNAESTYAKKSEIPSLEGYLQTSVADEKYATKTELEGKVDDADIADMLTKTEASSTYQPIGSYLTEIPSEYITESELDAKGYKKIEYLTQTQYDELPTKEEGVLYVITDSPEVVIPDTSDMLTKTEASSTYQPKGEYATTSQLASKQDTLVSGESIKTINGESVLGSGNIVIEGGSSDVDKAYVDEQLALKADKTSVPTVQENATGDTNNYIYSKFNDTTNIVVNRGDSPSNYDTLNKNVLSFVHIIRNQTEFKIRFNSWNSKSLSFNSSGDWMATNSKAGFITGGDKQKLDSINVSNLATKDELSAKQDTLVSGTNIKTVNGNSLLGEGDIVIEGGSTGNDVQEVAGIDNVSTSSVKENRIYIDTNTIEDVPQTYAPEVAATIAYGNIYLGNNGKLLKVYDKDTLTKTEASTTYALQSALQAALERIAALEAQVGNISTQLDNINGEVIN